MQDLVRDAGIEPVEAGDHMSHVQERSPVLHHLEHKGLHKTQDIVIYRIGSIKVITSLRST